jgi:hypothetical protein
MYWRTMEIGAPPQLEIKQLMFIDVDILAAMNDSDSYCAQATTA